MSSAQKLYEAILLNSQDRVRSLLDSGVDPDKSPECLLAGRRITFIASDRASRRFTFIAKIVSDNNEKARITPLHIAVLNCYFNEGSATIIQMLLAAGAQSDLTAFNVRIRMGGNLRDIRCVQGMSALELARTLYHDYQGPPALDNAINILGEAPQSKTVPDPIFNPWERLLFSEDFSDVHFVCSTDANSNSKVIHAHRCILAAASPYFAAYFKGPWSELHKDGRWVTANSFPVMSAVLSYIYTGRASKSTLRMESLNILSVATEYELPGLARLCAESCIPILSESNILSFFRAAHLYNLPELQVACASAVQNFLNYDNAKELLCLAHHHNDRSVKRECFTYIQSNSVHFLTDRDWLALSSEDPDLWDEMINAISPGNKRVRME